MPTGPIRALDYFQNIVETVREPLVVLDSELRVQGASRSFYQTFNVTREETEGRLIYELGDCQWNIPALRRLLEEILPEQSQFEGFEVEHDFQRVGRRVILLNARQIVTEEESATMILLAIEDITERKRVSDTLQIDLKQAESQFRALFENARDAVLISDDQGIYIDANPAACNLLGVSFHEVIGHTIDDFTNKNSEVQDPFSPEHSMHGVISVQHPDGRVVEVDSTITPNFLPGRHLSILRDVTERRKLEEQLRQSQKLESVGMLAGGVAHDFNNLLTVIAGYAQLTLKRLDNADPLARHLEEITKAADRASSLTRQLLAFSRKQLLQPRVFDLNLVISNLEKMLGRLVGEDMELRTFKSEGLGLVKADPSQIETVIINLAVNARDAMPSGGKITIETSNIYLDVEYARYHIAVPPGPYVMLAVTDNGHGMDRETQKFIFEPFFTTKVMGKGTGLGLATVYGIVKQSGGNIAVYSEVGVGTSFKIYLPSVDEEVTGVTPDAVPLENTIGAQTILLAEDEEMVRNLARDCLKLRGYTVLEAANGGEALFICQHHDGPIHLLLTDVVMPRMNGRSLAKEVLMLRSETRILYMSGYTDQSIVHLGVLNEGIAFIGKPFTPDALVRKIVEVLGTPLVESRQN
jgi:two-component system cell cycle sensor histidine kinase/response regulator CckA